MKAISLTQPWATLVACGLKAIETRSWAPSYRGPLLIHASKTFPRDCERLCYRDPFQEALLEAGYRRPEDLPLGALLAGVDLVGVRPSESFDDAPLTDQMIREFAFGDFSPRRFGLMLANLKRLQAPVPCRGALGLWTVPAPVLEQIRIAA